MYKRTVFLAFLTIKMTLLPVKAQFYTISADTAHLSHSSAQEEIPMTRQGTILHHFSRYSASFALIGTGRNTYDG